VLKLLFTCDYEIEGDGSGSPRELMVEPTRRLFRQLDACGARLTLMCEVAEVMRFRAHLEETSRDDFAYAEIERQLLEIVAAGHDVQLHIHPGYRSARLDGDGWRIDPMSNDLATLPYQCSHDLIREGKAFLEELLQRVDPTYRCVAFRSGAWSMQPSRNLVTALVSNGISIDTSVFKYGVRRAGTRFDYSSAPSQLVPWPVDPEEVCRMRPDSKLIEFPIYAESRPIWSFASRARLQRWLRARRRATPSASEQRSVRRFQRRHAWKADFNQCTGSQLIRALLRAEDRYGDPSRELPFVLIGHSKLFDARNGETLAPLLEFAAAHPGRFSFGSFADFDLESFRNGAPAS
jgi:hypothetical protein